MDKVVLQNLADEYKDNKISIDTFYNKITSQVKAEKDKEEVEKIVVAVEETKANETSKILEDAKNKLSSYIISLENIRPQITALNYEILNLDIVLYDLQFITDPNKIYQIVPDEYKNLLPQNTNMENYKGIVINTLVEIKNELVEKRTNLEIENTIIEKRMNKKVLQILGISMMCREKDKILKQQLIDEIIDKLTPDTKKRIIDKGRLNLDEIYSMFALTNSNVSSIIGKLRENEKNSNSATTLINIAKDEIPKTLLFNKEREKNAKKEIKEIDNVLAKLDKNSNIAKKIIETRKQYVAYLNELDKKVIESGKTISAVDSTQKENNKPHKLEQQLNSTYNEIASNHYDKKLSKLNKEKENAEAILKHFDKGLIHNLNIRKIDKLNKKIKLVENKKEQTITSSHIGDKYLSEKNIKLEEQKAKILSLNKIVENSKGLSKFVYSAVNEKEKIAYSINTKISKALTMFQKVSFQTKVVVDGVKDKKDALATMLTPQKQQVQTHSQQLVRA